jgi:phytoene desaturase
MIPYVEHHFGIYHVQGGLSEISAGMARAAAEDGAKIHYNTPVKRLILKGKECRGVELEDGRKIKADAVIVNADFAHAMTTIVPKRKLKKYTLAKLRKKRYSVSTFMIYLGLDKVYDIQHHTVLFAKNYRKNLDTISAGKIPWGNASFYVRNSSITDPKVAPPGHSGIYVLVPVPNKKAKIDWKKDGPKLRNWVIGQMKKRLGMHDIEQHIIEETVITPDNWKNDYDVFLGATFNLGHNLSQMLYFRPHNKFEELDNVYLVGGGTHPGSGLPTIYESGRISAGLICRKHGKECGRKIHG